MKVWDFAKDKRNEFNYIQYAHQDLISIPVLCNIYDKI